MIMHPGLSGGLSPPCCGFVLALLLFFGAPSGHAAAAAPVRDPPPACIALVGWSWSQIYSPIESMLGNRRRIIQALIVLMMLGLYVMWRKAVATE
jgi:hypothetical protein